MTTKMTTKMTTYDLLRKLKKDDTLRFGQWLWNLLDDSFECRVIADYDFGEANMAIADKLWNIQDDELIKLIGRE